MKNYEEYEKARNNYEESQVRIIKLQEKFLPPKKQMQLYRELKTKFQESTKTLQDLQGKINEVDSIVADKKNQVYLNKNQIIEIKRQKLYKRAAFATTGAKGYFFIFYNLLIAMLFAVGFIKRDALHYVLEYLKINIDSVFSILYRFSLYGFVVYILWRICCINHLFRKKERKEAKPLFDQVHALQKEIDSITKEIASFEEDRKLFIKTISELKLLEDITSEEYISYFAACFEIQL